MAKIGRNDPCPCGSGKKYKKCHLQHRPPSLPPEVVRKFMLDTQQRIEKGKFSGPPSMRLPLGHGKVGRIIWNVLRIRPEGETFHEYIINVLKWTLGEAWYKAQLRLNPDDRHVIMKWFAAYSTFTQSQIPPDAEPGQVHEGTLTGELKELLVLADDAYRLQLIRKLPRKLVHRLKTYDSFQGARYEIAIAATFVRCGFEIEWIEEKGTKHCEFNAKHKTTSDVIAVETKSRHRAGMLNRAGEPPSEEKLRADVESLLNQAFEQNPHNKPFAIFIDVNLPHEIAKDWPQKKWVAEVGEIIRRYPIPSPDTPSPYTFLVFTNYAWHYEGAETAAGSEAVVVFSGRPEFALRDMRTFHALGAALNNYGLVSNDE